MHIITNVHVYIIQVASSQWTLFIQLVEYHNPLNLETDQESNDMLTFCCCDDSSSTFPLPFLASNGLCAEECDVFFKVSLTDCDDSDVCTISTVEEVVVDSPATSNYGYVFTFNLETIPEKVAKTRFCNSYFEVFSSSKLPCHILAV